MSARARPMTISICTAFVLAACAATHNPRVGDARPAPPPKTTAQPQAQPDADPTAESATPQAQAQPEKPAAAAQAGAAPASAPNGVLVLGSVGGQPIDAREFLARLWMRDHRLASEALEQIVFARLAMNEADRLGVTLDPERVDAVVAKTLAALEKKLADSKAKLSLDEYIRASLELEPEYYKARLRGEAVEHLLAERCVRAWAFENERRDVKLIEVRDATALAKVRTALDGGRPFDDVAREFGSGGDEATHVQSHTFVRAENQELARAAFATTVGSVFGPLEQSGRWLFMLVEAHHDPETGPWSQIGPKIEESLKTDPIGELDYVQWRAAMVRRYKVDFDPFLDAVSGKKS